jgi:FG-GAP repeat
MTNYLTMGDVDGDGKPDVIQGTGYYNEGTHPCDSAIIILRNTSTPGSFTF